jgi:TIR domain
MTMPAIVPGFKHDVFVSYAHVDNGKFGRESGWVETLVENLRDGLPRKLKRSQPDIWRDLRLSSSEPFSEVIREAVTQAATLLVILSESYLTSDWCRQELALFLEAAKQTGGARGRIFLVRLDTLEHDSWPEAFHGLLGQKFFEQATVDAPARMLGTAAANDPGQHLYFQQLDDLMGELAGKLLQMKQAAEISVVPPSTQTSQGPQPGDGSPVVFLAETTPDLDDWRDQIRRYLIQANIRVLPDTHYDRAPQAYRAALAADLDHSLLFVQLLGLYVSAKTSDVPKGYEGLQLDVAEEKGLAILRWHDPDLNVASAKDQVLLTRAEVMVTAFEEFKREIVNAVKKRLAEKKAEAIQGNGAYVLINANSRDEQATDMLFQVLDRQGIGYDTADENESILNLVDQYDFQGLMIVYGQCEKEWAKQQMRACREILLKKKQRAPLCAVFMGPPDEKPALGISLPKVAQVSHRDRSTIASFLLAVQASLSGA